MTKASHAFSSICLLLLLVLLYSPAAVHGHAAFTQNLLSNITYRRLQVDHMMPIHGRFVPYSEFLEAAIRMRSMTSMAPTTD